MAETIKSATVVVNTGIAAAIRYGGLSTSGQPSYGAKLQISRVVVGSVEISNLNENTSAVPGIVWDSRNPNDNPLNPNGEVPMSFLNYQVISDKTMAFVVNLPESAGPFTVKTIGLYARDDSGKDILFSVSQYTPAVDKIASSEETTGYSQSYWIFITMSGISRLFTEDGSPVVHPNPVQIQPINNSYATIPQVVDETKLPVPATSSIYNLYYIENIKQYQAPGLAVRSGATWNYILALKKETYNSFSVTSSMLNDTESKFKNKVVYVDSTGRFGINDGTKQPVGIYKDGRIYVANGYIDFEDSLEVDLVPGSLYYATEDGKFTKDTETDWIIGKALSKSTFLIDFTDKRYATEDRKGLIQIATKEEVQSGTNANKVVTPFTLNSVLATQENPEQAINSYFGTIKKKNFSIRRIPRTGDNFYDIEVTAYLPRLLPGTGIKQEKVVKKYSLAWRRNPISYPTGNKTDDTSSWEATPIKLAGTWNYTDQSTSIRLSQSSQDIQETNEYNKIQIGDYIYVGGVSGPDTVRQIVAINGSTQYTSGVVQTIDVTSGLRQLPSDSEYYLLKSPNTNVQYFYQYIKLYWKLVEGVPTVDFDYITSYRPSQTDDYYKLPSDWTDSLDYFIAGNLIELNPGFKVGNSVYPTFTNYCFGDYSRYKIGEVVTIAANPVYSTNGTNANITNEYTLTPPESGMVLADGRAVADSSSFYLETGMTVVPNLRTYNQYANWSQFPVLMSSTDAYYGWRLVSLNIVPPGYSIFSNVKTSRRNTLENVYNKPCLQNATYFFYQPDSDGGEGCSIYVANAITINHTVNETSGSASWYRFNAKKGQSISINSCSYGLSLPGCSLNVWYDQFQPGTVSWVKINKE